MTGQYSVIVENAYIRYEFEIHRNITVIRGQSASGKTTLFEMIRSYQEEEDSGVSVKCDKKLAVLYGKEWKKRIGEISDSIVFLDEQSRFALSDEFAEAVKGSDNYYVIISREKLSALPYSVTEVYGIRMRGKYAGLAGEFTENEFYRIYGIRPVKRFKPDVVITEDSNSGYEFWKRVCGENRCFSAEGKTKILETLRGEKDRRCLAIVDGAAFGPEMEGILQYIRYRNPDAEIYAPESFEYLLLTSGLFTGGELKDKCSNTADYADSVQYLSWEQFYSALLTEITMGTEMQYSKKKLNLYYLSERNMRMVLQTIPEELLVSASGI